MVKLGAEASAQAGMCSMDTPDKHGDQQIDEGDQREEEKLRAASAQAHAGVQDAGVDQRGHDGGRGFDDNLRDDVRKDAVVCI